MTKNHLNHNSEDFDTMIERLNREFDTATKRFDTHSAKIRKQLNEEFAEADKALHKFMQELGDTSDLEAN